MVGRHNSCDTGQQRITWKELFWRTEKTRKSCIQSKCEKVRILSRRIKRLGIWKWRERYLAERKKCMTKNIVVSLCKKCDRKTLGSFQWFCILPMSSRILARVLATRLRTSSEKQDPVGDTQQGFRASSRRANHRSHPRRTPRKKTRTSPKPYS